MGKQRNHQAMGWLISPLLSLPFPALMPPAATAETILSLERTSRSYPSGDLVWLLKLTDGANQIASWQAASGTNKSQKLDRRWSPGNGAPLPAGKYRLGPAEPFGQDLWIDLQPEFDTSRSALGIHNCFPGVGCICIPDRKAMGNLSEIIQKWRIKTLTVVN